MLGPRTRDILFSSEHLAALRELRGARPRRIVSDGLFTFWFDLGDRYMIASVAEFTPLSQNAHDEALAVRPQWRSGPCDCEGEVLFDNALITDVLIVRTLLWFTDHTDFHSERDALAGLPEPTTETERTLQRALAGSTGGHQECVSRPADMVTIEAPVANLVDVGFIAVVNDRKLACFTQINAYAREADYVDALKHDFSSCYEALPLNGAAVGGSN
jgi:hypothetical protein